MTRASAGRHARGAALLLVLWLIALLAALVGAFALTARTEHLQGRVLHRGVVASEAARAGLEYAVARVIDTTPEGRWLPDGRDYAWRFHDAALTLRIVDETGKVDLNVAQPPLLAGLLQAAGAEADMAEQLAGAIADWRDTDDLGQPSGAAEDPQYAAAGLPYGAKDAPFEDVGELQQVLGMTPRCTPRSRRTSRSTAGCHRRTRGSPARWCCRRWVSTRSRCLSNARNCLESPRRRTCWAPEPARIVSTAMPASPMVARRCCGRWCGSAGAPGTAYTPLFWNEGVSVSEPQSSP